MTAEQLEELLRKGEEGFIGAHYTLSKLAPSLARRVIAAEKLVEAASEALANYFEESGEYISGMKELQKALTAYREASKARGL